MEQPLVTVITVCYNAREMLLRTMNSVWAQTYKHVEYVIVDGASTDGTLELLEEYGGRIDHWVSESDKGIYDAMNKGVSMAKGKWVIFMNAGDCFADNHVLENVFSVPRQADVIYGDVVKGGVVKKASSPRNAHRMFFCHQSVFVKIESLKAFPFDISHKMSADFVNAYLVELRNLRNTYMLDYAQQPITSYAIAYKAVRNTGILNKLYKMARTDQSKKYNLV